jgi:aminoglycoside phosphotransferase (APT) family kinase protein
MLRVTGDLRALLIPPQETRFRSLMGLDGISLRLITSGWHRLVVVAPDRVFTFPRHTRQVQMLEREADLLPAIRLDIAPRVLGLHRDEGISPYPFLELSRIPGRSYDTIMEKLTVEEVARALEQVARQAARWHELPVPERFRSRPSYREAPRALGSFLQPDTLASAACRAAELLAPLMPAPADLWQQALAPVAAMKSVTVHGELSEGQFLFNDRLRLNGIVDWDALHVAHPLVDFDLGIGAHNMHRSDRSLKQRMWQAYIRERSDSLPDWPYVNLFWSLLDAVTLARQAPNDARLRAVLVDLDDATKSLR